MEFRLEWRLCVESGRFIQGGAGRLLRVLLFLSMSVFLVSSCRTAEPRRNVIRIPRGGGEVLHAAGLRRIAVGDPEVLEILLLGEDRIELVGLECGVTTLYLWDSGGRRRITVGVVPPWRPAGRALRRRIEREIGLPGVRVKLVESPGNTAPLPSVILEGRVGSAAEAALAESVAACFCAKVINRLVVEGASEEPAVELRRLVDNPDVEVLLQGSGRGGKASVALLQGTVGDEREKRRVLALAGLFAERVEDMLEVVSPVQIMVVAHLLELSKNRTKNFGLSIGGVDISFEGEDSPPSVDGFTPNALTFIENLFYSFRGDVFALGPRIDPLRNFPWEFENLNRLSSLMVRLQFQLQENEGRLLASPILVTGDGRPASLRLGGSIPLRTSTRQGDPRIDYKDYGLEMNIVPTLKKNGDIDLALKLEWTSIDHSTAITVLNTPIPGMITRMTSTHVLLHPGQPLIVSGIIRKEDSASWSGNPLFERVPVLGELFASRTFLDGTSELVVVLSAEVVEDLGRISGLRSSAGGPMYSKEDDEQQLRRSISERVERLFDRIRKVIGSKEES